MFCPGISMLGNGDVLVTGGSNAEKTSMFRQSWNKPRWTAGPSLNTPRGYNSQTTTSQGQVALLACR